jgi:hypothetical protein
MSTPDSPVWRVTEGNQYMLRTEAIGHSIRRLMFVFSVPVIRSFVHCILNYVTDVLTALDGGHTAISEAFTHTNILVFEIRNEFVLTSGIRD